MVRRRSVGRRGERDGAVDAANGHAERGGGGWELEGHDGFALLCDARSEPEVDRGARGHRDARLVQGSNDEDEGRGTTTTGGKGAAL